MAATIEEDRAATTRRRRGPYWDGDDNDTTTGDATRLPHSQLTRYTHELVRMTIATQTTTRVSKLRRKSPWGWISRTVTEIKRLMAWVES
ncbi:hypothetical protein V6N13_053447 [Hibiscus sabdariffa]|uniref:Uncharacterized protein n=1 Tax=Hibiscus sabdariffa TaxID=183260 RepID=A0ABR2T8D3_9ROSI